MKILFVMQMPPPVHGVSVMNKLIFDSKLINSAFDCEYINLATARDINDLQKNRFTKYIATVKILLQCLSKIRKGKIDLVYITIFPYGFSFIKDSCVVILCRLFRIKHVLHLHTYGFKKAASSSIIHNSVYRYVFKKARVICLSKLLVEDIETFYSKPVYILPNGIPQVNFENNYKKDQDPVTILFLSNLIKGKGILVLFDAVEILKNKGFTFKLRVTGPENDINYRLLEDLAAQKGLTELVSFGGAKYGEQKYKEFSEAGIFVLPTDYDTFGLVLLEAMQFGVPCVSTAIGAIPDVLGEQRGVIISEILPGVLADAILLLLTNATLRSEMSTRSFDYFLKNFTSDIFEHRLKDILGQCLNQVNNVVITK